MKKVICIDAGHGGKDPGAVNGRCYESVATLAIALEVGRLLNLSGYEVVYTRRNDTYLTLAQRCKISNEANALAFISIHLNAATNKSAKGVETWRYNEVGGITKALAKAVQKAIIEDTGMKDRGVKETNNLYVLKHTKAPAILIECGFISNDSECSNLFKYSIQRKIAKSIYKGLVATIK